MMNDEFSSLTVNGFLNKCLREPFIVLLATPEDKAAVSHLENGDTMGERIGRIRRIQTDFF
jgi:hypothetical protein